MEGELFVIKRDGKKETISFDKVLRRIQNLCKDPALPNLNIDGTLVAQKVCSRIYPGVTTTELDELASQICASMITQNAEYETLASRISISNHHKNTDSDMVKMTEQLYEDGILSKSYYETILRHGEIINCMIRYEKDYLFTYFGYKTLEKSYLLRNKKNRIMERPQHMWMRVSLSLYPNDLIRAFDCYHEMSNFYYTHATPTLFNAGTCKQQLASCFLMSMKEDSIHGIYETLKNCALISKYSGGVGLHIHNIRGAGSFIKGTNGTSNGIIPMLRVFNDTARYVDQGGGKRNGSFAIYLEPWHCDVFDFLQLKKNHGDENTKARDLFYALWIPNLFMERVQNDQCWSLMSPDECPGLSEVYGKDFEALYLSYEQEGKYRKQIRAQLLWTHILNAQIETGTPYMVYKDHCNEKSNQKNIGIIKSSNLCTEIVQVSTEEETAVCNLASINLCQFIEMYNGSSCTFRVHCREQSDNNHGILYGKLACAWIRRIGGTISEYSEKKRVEWIEAGYDDTSEINIWMNDQYIGDYLQLLNHTRPYYNYDRLQYITRQLVRNLNQAIDVNDYPLPETKRSNLRHRPIGIGVQGYADMFLKMRIPLEHVSAFEMNEKIFASIYYAALDESCLIAQERYEWITHHNKQACHIIFQKDYDDQIPPLSPYVGAYATFDGSPLSQGIFQFDLWKEAPLSCFDWKELRQRIQQYGVRNSLLVAPMPTASTSQILGNNECFEPLHSNIYVRRTLAGEFVVINKYLMEDLQDIQLWSTELKNQILMNEGSIQSIKMIPPEIRDLYKIVWEIPCKTILDMSIQRGKYVCQSQSLNLFVRSPTIPKLSNMHFYAWKRGLKTGMYYLRTQPIAKAQQFSIDPVQENKSCMSCSA